MKNAIRIVSGATGQKKLFAIVADEHINKYYFLAKQTFEPYSSDWISIDRWDFDPVYWKARHRELYGTFEEFVDNWF